MTQNLLSKVMPDAEHEEILADLDALVLRLEKYRHSLTPAERKSLARIKNASLELLETAATFAEQNPKAVAGDTDVEELRRDLALARKLAPIRARAAQILQLLEDSMISVLSDAYVASLDIYRVAQALGRGAGFEPFLDAFGARFTRGPRKPKAGE